MTNDDGSEPGELWAIPFQVALWTVIVLGVVMAIAVVLIH